MISSVVEEMTKVEMKAATKAADSLEEMTKAVVTKEETMLPKKKVEKKVKKVKRKKPKKNQKTQLKNFQIKKSLITALEK